MIQLCHWMGVFCVIFAVRLSQNHGSWDFTRKFTSVCKINTACIVGRNSQIKPILMSTKPRNMQMENIRSNLESKLLGWWLGLGLKKLPKNWCFMNQPWDLGWQAEVKTTAVNVTNRSNSNPECDIRENVDTNECPNIYSWPIYSNIRIFEYIRHTLL